MTEDEIQQVMDIKARHETALLQKANVLAVGVGYREKEGQLTDQIVLVVSVKQKQSVSHLSTNDIIPATIEGVGVDVREVGDIQTYSE